MRTKLAIAFLFLLSSTVSFAGHNYYPQKYQDLFEGKSAAADLKDALFTVLQSTHQRQGSKRPDRLGCDRNNPGECYNQTSLSYRDARKLLFGKLHLEEDANGHYVRDVYCRKNFRNQVGPMKIPDPNTLNCEHTWPQSRFTTRFAKDVQKSDLHHLFPTDSRANSVRGNHEFGEVDEQLYDISCQSSHFGTLSGREYFEPPQEHKGNVARAVFYFAVRYQLEISATEEDYLRRWHNEDPVDAEEMERNENIYQIQNNRNPFIDYPHLVSQVKDF